MRKALPLIFLFAINIGYAQITSREVIFDNADDMSIPVLLDINGDQQLDIYENGYFLNGVKTFFHTGLFNYTSSGALKVNMGATDFERGHFQFIDVDNDNDQDMLFVDGCSGCPVQGINLYENVNGTSFEFRYQIADQFLGYDMPVFVVSDYDKDGDQDALMSYEDFSDIEILLLRNNQGSFSVTPIDYIEDLKMDRAFATDLDADGDQEAIFLGEGTIYVYINNAGQFEDPDEYSGGNAFAHFEDINGDGVTDIYYKLSTCLYVIPAIPGGFGDRVTYHCGTSGDTDFYLHDHDGDGDLDIYHGNNLSGGVYWKERAGDQFNPSKRLSFTGYQIKRVEAFDPNQDGMDDLLLLGDDGYLGILERSGTQPMSLTHTIASYLDSRHVNSYQIEPDSAKELIVFHDDWIGYMNPDTTDHSVTTIFNSTTLIQDAGFSDLDGDQDPDLYILFLSDVTSNADTSLVWLENDGQKFKSPKVILFDFNDGGSVKALDMEHDGDQDMVVFSTFSTGKVLLNNGQGEFATGQTIAAPAFDAVVKDINLDGWDDLLSWHSNSGVYYYRNKRDGSFYSAVKIGNDPFPVSCDAGNFNGHGPLEILVSDNNNGLNVYFNPAGNSWFKSVNIPLDYADAIAMDFYREGRDAILSGYNLTYYHSNTILEFELQNEFLEDAKYSQLILADFDQSGIKDLVGYDGKLYLHSDVEITTDIDGDGYGFGEDCDALNPDVNPGATEVANNILDENCDGIYLYIDNDHDGYYSDVDCNDMNPDINPDANEIPGNGIDENCDGSDDFQDADMDGYAVDEDCNDSNASINPGAEDFPGNTIDEDCSGTAAVSWLDEFVTAQLSNPILDIDTADFTGDGLPEILVANHQSALLFSYADFNNPTTIIQNVNKSFTHIAGGDFDQDGDQDVVLFEVTEKELWLILNNGNGQFPTHKVIGSVDNYSIDMEVADIDHDGFLDILVVPYIEPHHDIIIFYGDGTDFEKNRAIPDVNQVGDVYLYDLDKDDDLDIFATRNTGIPYPGVIWVRNEGDRLFSDQLPICTKCENLKNCIVLDYDNDGKPECIAGVFKGASSDPEAINGTQAWEWDGTNWTLENKLTANGGYILQGDMNMDCRIDLVCRGFNDSYLYVFYNKPILPFLIESFNYNVNTYDFVVTDFNGDQFADIVAGVGGYKLMLITNKHEARDFDHDGFTTGFDCDDCNFGKNPDATEIPNNGLDEDCDGVDLITATVDASEYKFSIYPNPASDITYLSYDRNETVTIEVFDLVGNKWLSKRNPEFLELWNLGNGIYEVKIMIQGHKPISRKLVIQH